MTYYYCIIGYYLLGCLFLKKNVTERVRKRYALFALFPVFFLVAFRSVSVGNDTYTYYYAFEKYKNYNSLGEVFGASLREPVFLILNYLCIKFGLSYYYLQVGLTILIYHSLYRYLVRYSKDIWLSCLLFVLNRHMFATMNTMRMWVAVAIVMYAVPYILEKKLIQVLLLTGLAMTFHFSAIVYIALYYLINIKWNEKNILITITVASIISVAGRSFFSFLTRIFNRYVGYLDGRYFDSGGIATYISLLIQICFFVFIYYEYSKWRAAYSSKDNQVDVQYQKNYDNYIITSMLIMVILDIIGLNNTIMSRISAFFSTALYLAVPYALTTTNRRNRPIMAFAIVLLLLLNFIIVMKFRPGWYGVSDYSFFWQSPFR